MSEQASALKPSIGPFMAIAEMPPFYLWFRPESIGSSQEEGQAAIAGKLSPARLSELEFLAQHARVTLRDKQPEGRA